MCEKLEKSSSFELKNLPSVVLGKILKILPKTDRETLSLVCTSWRSTLYCRSKRSQRLEKQQRMDFYNKQTYEPGSLEPFLLSWERKIILKQKTIMSPAFLEHHTVENYNVRNISMIDVKISLEDLKELIVRSPRLSILGLGDVNLNEDVCRAIGENLKELRSLRLSWSTNIGDGINLILQGCRKLEWVRLVSLTESPCFVVGELPKLIRILNVERFQAITSDENLKTLVESCPCIEELRYGIIVGSFTEKSLEMICRLKNLKNLILRFSKISVPALDFGRLNEIGSLEKFHLKDTTISSEEQARIQASLPGVKFLCRVKKIALAENQNHSVGTNPDPDQIITIERSQDSSGTDFSDGDASQRTNSSSRHPSLNQASSSGVEGARRGKKRRRYKRKREESLNRLVPNLRNVKHEQDLATVETVGGPSASCKTEKMEPMDQNGSEQQVGMENVVVKSEPIHQRIKQEQDIEVMETTAEPS